MGLQFYADSGATQPIRMVLGSLSDSGSSFAVDAEPNEVRKYNTSAPNGNLLTKNTSTPTSPGTGEWGYSSGTVYLGDALTSGDTAVAFSAGVRVLESVNTLSGKAKFATNTGVVNDRIKQQQLWLKNTESAKQYTNVSISLADIVSGAGSDVSRYQFATDNSGTPNAFGTAGGSLTSTDIAGLATMAPSDVVTFWVQCTVPENDPVANLRDIEIKATSTEEATN
jgi:hypothetical protein